jgi:hypothetical protein
MGSKFGLARTPLLAQGGHIHGLQPCRVQSLLDASDQIGGVLDAIDSRIVESRMPIFWRMSAGTPVMLAGKLASDRVPPRLAASLKI